MEKIQKVYKLKRLKRAIDCFKKLNLLNLVRESEFDKFTDVVKHKSVMGISNIMLNRVNRVLNFNEKVNTKVFLSAYLIYGYSDIVLSKDRNNLEEELYKMADKLIDKTEKLCINVDMNNRLISSLYINNFRTTFNQFNILFAIWKHIDKEGIIEMLAMRYDSLRKSKKFIMEDSKFTDTTKKETIEIITSQLEDIEKKVKTIDKNFNIEHFKKFSEIKDKVEYNFNKAFWDLMSKDIKKDNYESVIKHIKQLIQIICSMIPNRTDLHEQIKDKIDIEIIEQLIENKMFDGKTLYEYTGYIFDWLKKLGSSSREQDLDKIWEEMISTNDKEYALLVPEIFKMLYKIIDLIKMDMAIICG